MRTGGAGLSTGVGGPGQGWGHRSDCAWSMSRADRCCWQCRQTSTFVDWATVFRRASDRIRDRFEPRFPNVYPHRLRHLFSLGTLENLVSGYYAQAAKLVADTDNNAALALYLTKADPIQVLRDLLGHSSVLTTQVYLSRIDLTVYSGRSTRTSAGIRGCPARYWPK